MRALFTFVVAVVIATASSWAQQNSMLDEYLKFKGQAKEEYKNFRDQANKEYAKFMEEAWEKYSLSAPIQRSKENSVGPQIINPDDTTYTPHNFSQKNIEVIKPEEIKATPKPQPLSPLDADTANIWLVTLDADDGSATNSFMFMESKSNIAPLWDNTRSIRRDTLSHSKAKLVRINTISSAPQDLALAGNKPKTVDNPNVTKDEPTLAFTFYGTDCQVRYKDSQKFELPKIDNKSLSKAWTALCTPENDATLQDCLLIRDIMKLNDWAYMRFLDNVAKEALGEGNAANLLAAYLFSQSGYKMKLARDKDRLFMMIGSDKIINGYPFLQKEGDFYFTILPDVKNIDMYPRSFPNSQLMNLLFTEDPVLKKDMSEPHHIQVTPKAKRFQDLQVDYSINKNLIDYYNDYPSLGTKIDNDDFLMRWSMYANVPLDEDVKAQLYPSIIESIEGFSKRDAANKILWLISSGLEYKYDNEVWGYDRAFFPEETLYYPYCDCEDRSILYSRLVRDILDLDVALVYYPGHLATAVAFDEDVAGDYILIDGRKFTICDATIISWDLGRTMDGMNNNQARAIITERKTKKL